MSMDLEFAAAGEFAPGTTMTTETAKGDALFGESKENDSPEPEKTSRRRSVILSSIAKGFSTPRRSLRDASRKARNQGTPAPLPPSKPLSKPQSNAQAAPAKRKRKRDSIESDSSQESVYSETGASEMFGERPFKKSAMDRVQSLASTVGMSPPISFIRKRSARFEQGTPPSKQRKFAIKEYHSPKMLKCQPKEQQLWVNTVEDPELYSADLIKRQEAIYEIFLHAQSMFSDAKTVVENYMRPMQKLNLLSKQMEEQLFGDIVSFLPLHESIVTQVRELRSPENGTTECIGETLQSIFGQLRQMVQFCANLHLAKTAYDRLCAEPSSNDFLERCRKSSFSNKRSLWDFLDSQRSNLLKYPLLLKSVLQRTREDHADHEQLQNALADLEDMLAEMDEQTGAVRCADVLKRLVYVSDSGRCPIVDSSTSLVYSGNLKLVRGSRVEVFLFDKALVITRPVTRNEETVYQTFLHPFYTINMCVERVGTTQAGGSFRGVCRSNSTTSNVSAQSSLSFCVKRTRKSAVTFGKELVQMTFIASSEHDCKAWVDIIATTTDKAASNVEEIRNQQRNCLLYKDRSCVGVKTTRSATELRLDFKPPSDLVLDNLAQSNTDAPSSDSGKRPLTKRKLCRHRNSMPLPYKVSLSDMDSIQRSRSEDSGLRPPCPSLRPIQVRAFKDVSPKEAGTNGVCTKDSGSIDTGSKDIDEESTHV